MSARTHVGINCSIPLHTDQKCNQFCLTPGNHFKLQKSAGLHRFLSFFQVLLYLLHGLVICRHFLHAGSDVRGDGDDTLALQPRFHYEAQAYFEVCGLDDACICNEHAVALNIVLCFELGNYVLQFGEIAHTRTVLLLIYLF